MSIYFYGCVTMDGYLADSQHNLQWLHDTGTPEETSYLDFYQQMDITIMGRKTFSEIAKFENPAAFYPTTINYVFTHANDFSEPGFIPVNEEVVNFVKQLDANKNIWIVGGNTLLAPLLENNMIDHIILQIAPVLLGNGIPLFTQKEQLQRFNLIEVKQYGQFAELIYQKGRV